MVRHSDRFLVTILLALFFLFPLIFAPGNVAHADGGSISGKVTAADGTTPISGARVNVTTTSSSTAVAFADTLADGTYTVTGLPSGQYRAYAFKSGYERKYYDNDSTSGGATTISVISPNNVPNISFSLGPGGSISGKVRNADGSAALANIQISISQNNWKGGRGAKTGSDGGYTVTNLPYGSYTVWAGRGETEEGDSRYVREYYNNKALNQTPDVLTVSAGVNPTGIDFTLAIGGSISGKVTQQDGTTPIAGATVKVYIYNTGEWVNEITTTQDGTYTIPGIPTGQFQVYAWADGRELRYYPNAVGSNEALPINVTAPGVTANINISLGPGGTISGTVRNADGSAALPRIRVYALPADGSNWSRYTTSASDGSYVLPWLPYSSYKIYAGRGERSGGDSRYIREYYNNKALNQTPDTVSVALGINPTGIDFTLAIGGSISGKVSQQDGATPVAGANVRAYIYGTWEWVNDVSSASDGTYTIPGIPTAQLAVYALAEGRERKYYGNVYGRENSSPVNVTSPNNTPNINFSLGPGGAISGTVRNADGSAALPNMHVSAAPTDGSNWGVGARTRGDGTFTISSLPYKSYKIWAGRGESEGGDSRYVREYYNNKALNQTPDTVSVALGINPTGIDFTLAIGGSISGKVTQQDGATPVAGANVRAYFYATGEWVNDVKTAGDGTYTIPGIPSGQFRVYAFADGRERKYYNNTYNRDNATPVTVTAASNTPNINFPQGPAGTISGTVRNADGSIALPNMRITASPTDGSNWSIDTQSTSNGTYVLTSVPYASYRIWAGRGETEEGDSRYVREYYNNKALNQTPDVLTVSAGVNPTGIDFTLAIGGSISGKVTQQDGATPISGAKVQVLYSMADQWINDATTGSDGSYSIPGIPPGSHKVKATKTGYATEYYNNAYSSGSSTLVSVTAPNSTPNINFTLLPTGSISGRVTDQDTGGVLNDAAAGSMVLSAGWHKLVYRQEDGWGSGGAKAVFKAPGDANWRLFSTDQLEIKTSLAPGAPAGIMLTTRRNTWTRHPNSHNELVRLVDVDATADSGWYGQSVVSVIDQRENMHGNDDYYTSYYEAYFNVTVPGPWRFATTSDDASEVVVDDNVVAYWYEYAWLNDRWDNRGSVGVVTFDTREWVKGTVINADGSYVITDLPAGNFLVSARSPGYAREYFREAKVSSTAAMVVVTAGAETQNVNFTLQKAGSISGKVTREDGATPIGGAWVYAQLYSTGERVNEITTGPDGAYILPAMPPGEFLVYAWAEGREGKVYNGVYGISGATPVSVTSLNNTPNILFSLGPGGTISGTVRNADGSATLANIQINASPMDGSNWARFGVSRNDGTYIITGLPYNTYKVYAGRGELYGGDSRYVREYYNNKALNQTPDVVTVSAGINPTGIDFTLAVGGSISGKVTQLDGATPVAGARVYAYVYNTKQWVNDISTGADGAYTLPGIPTGQFYVRAWADDRELRFYSNVLGWSNSTPVSVTSPNNTPNINFSLGPGGAISGTVRNADGSAALGNIFISAAPTDGSNWDRSATSAGNGTYTITGLPYNTYKVYAGRGEIRGGDSRYVREYYNNKALNQTPDVVTVSAGVNPAGIDFTLAVGGSISGKVTQQDGATPISGARVYAYVFGTWEWINDIATAADGTYTLPGIRPGQVLVSASASGRELRYYNNVTVRDSATAVNVTSGSNTPNINFSLGSAGGTYKAEIAFTHDIDPNAYLGAKIVRFFNSITSETVTFSDGIGAFDADMIYNGSGVSIKAATGITPFSSPTVGYNVDGATRTSVVAFQTSAAPQPPIELFRLYPGLTGSKDNAYTITLHFNTITRVSGTEIPQNADVVKTFQRGDANSTGNVNVTDALFIAQYLASLRGLGETTSLVNPVNAATPRNDSETAGSTITIADALYIAQMLASLRDASYNMIS